jgi:predicted alpha-1,2-mannosidase
MLSRRMMLGLVSVCVVACGSVTGMSTAAAACLGDCDGSGDVTVNELIVMVNVALGSAQLGDCPPGDADGSGDITINEIIAAVNNALNSCPTEVPTPTPTESPTPSVTPVTHTVVVGPDGNLRFDPANLTIHVGDAVQWTWSSAGHNVVSGGDCTADDQFCSPNDGNCAHAPLSGNGTTYTHTFTAEGTYPYYCSQHCGLGMAGTITVEPAFAAAPVIQYVDPFIGSGGLGFGFGSAVTGAVAPFGMVRLGPDTAKGGVIVPFYHYSGYYYDDQTIMGFSHLHFHGTGANGYGDLLVMPVPGFTPDKIKTTGYRSNFSKSTEIASPGYYAARLNNGNILAELTSTGRVGVHRYTFPSGASGAAVVIDAGRLIADSPARNIDLTIDPDGRTVVGHHRAEGGMSGGFDLYWAIAFDRPLKGYGGWRGQEVLADATSITAPTEGGGVYLEFDVPDGGSVNLRVGLSMVDLDGAKNNLATEAPDFDFDATRARTEARWESMLGRVKVAAGNTDSDARALRMFYTAAYHSLIMPTIFSDADGRYRGFDHQTHQADGFQFYSDLSLWDTFRTLHPWLTLAYPEVQRDIVISLLKMYEQDHFLPIWPVSQGDSGTMIGASAELVIADSFVKGIRDYDTAEAYEAVTRSGREPRPPTSTSPGRRHIEDYLALGYVPQEDDESSTSMTLEYAASDGALSEFAKAFGRDADAAEFAGRAGNYRNHWDSATKFFRAKYRDGSFKTPFDAKQWDVDYRESTAWQYLWYVPHDPQGLIELFGGRESFVDALESFFEKSKQEHDKLNDVSRMLPRTYYWAGNEPDIHTAYLFVDAGRADLAGHWSRWVLETAFGSGPDGLPGNDDCGTMGSWYLFTALGFYPVPGYDKYYVGAPLFPTTEITLPSGVLRINAPGAGPGKDIPRQASLNGTELPAFIFRHSDLAHGGKLDVELTSE